MTAQTDIDKLAKKIESTDDYKETKIAKNLKF